MPIDCCEIEIRVRYAEVDQMGCVHHSRYAVFFEMGRTELLRQNGLAYRDMERTGAFFVVAKLQIRYHAAAKYDDLLRLETRTVRLTPARVDHDYTLYRKSDNLLLAKAATTLACVDRNGSVMAIPDDFFSSIAAQPA